MKKVFLISTLLLFVFCTEVLAQDYDTYLRTAFDQLANDNIEIAKRHYSVYKQLTQKTNEDFEFLLAEKETNNWQKDCYIISLGGNNYLAVKKGTEKKFPVTWKAAYAICKNYHGGGFCDWRLPSEEELFTIFSSINWPDYNNYYWISSDYSSDSAGIVRANCNGIIIKNGTKTNWVSYDIRTVINSLGEMKTIKLSNNADVIKFYKDIMREEGIYFYEDVKYQYMIVRRFRK